MIWNIKYDAPPAINNIWASGASTRKHNTMSALEIAEQPVGDCS